MKSSRCRGRCRKAEREANVAARAPGGRPDPARACRSPGERGQGPARGPDHCHGCRRDAQISRTRPSASRISPARKPRRRQPTGSRGRPVSCAASCRAASTSIRCRSSISSTTIRSNRASGCRSSSTRRSRRTRSIRRTRADVRAAPSSAPACRRRAAARQAVGRHVERRAACASSGCTTRKRPDTPARSIRSRRVCCRSASATPREFAQFLLDAHEALHRDRPLRRDDDDAGCGRRRCRDAAGDVRAATHCMPRSRSSSVSRCRRRPFIRRSSSKAGHITTMRAAASTFRARPRAITIHALRLVRVAGAGRDARCRMQQGHVRACRSPRISARHSAAARISPACAARPAAASICRRHHARRAGGHGRGCAGTRCLRRRPSSCGTCRRCASRATRPGASGTGGAVAAPTYENGLVARLSTATCCSALRKSPVASRTRAAASRASWKRPWKLLEN